jgi:hypothetical protein
MTRLASQLRSEATAPSGARPGSIECTGQLTYI